MNTAFVFALGVFVSGFCADTCAQKYPVKHAHDLGVRARRRY